MLEPAARILAAAAPLLPEVAAALQSQLKPEAFDSFLTEYLAAFGHAARGRCPLNEIEYGDIKADPLFQPHRLADLAAFYRAFGLEVAADADERHDHICLELEFMCVLAAKEAYALEQQLDPEELSICRDAQKRFLREHLGRWTPAFARRLARTAGDTPLGALANFTRSFVEAECARYGISPGSEDLLLRPVDEAAESMCNSCGVPQTPPGAVPQP
jgi:DMSO reductase family type II enzyme chaperone